MRRTKNLFSSSIQYSTPQPEEATGMIGNGNIFFPSPLIFFYK
jgi:hypothetical protein